jgi:hypothetical protein
MTEEGTAETPPWETEEAEYNQVPACMAESSRTQTSVPRQGSDQENQIPLEQSSAMSASRGTSR